MTKALSKHLSAALGVAEVRDGFVDVKAGRCSFRVKEENTADIAKRLLRAHIKPSLSRQLPRSFPHFEPGRTSTAAYIEQYQMLNSVRSLKPWKYIENDKPTATYEGGALDFEVIEEHDAHAEELVADLL
jgi:hypothetical protein